MSGHTAVQTQVPGPIPVLSRTRVDRFTMKPSVTERDARQQKVEKLPAHTRTVRKGALSKVSHRMHKVHVNVHRYTMRTQCYKYFDNAIYAKFTNVYVLHMYGTM